MASLVITKKPNDYFSFVLDGDVANEILNIRNSLTVFGIECHFKTSNGANLVKNQQITPTEVTIIDGATTYNPTTPTQLIQNLKTVGYYDWIDGGGSGGVDRFDELDDTFEYFGNDGKVAIVNESQQKLEASTFYNYNKFVQLNDVPSVVVPGKILVGNPAGDALIFGDVPPAPTDATKLDSGGYAGTGQDLADADQNLQDQIDNIVVNDATTTVKGILKLAGDLGGTADLPTVPALVNKADLVAGKVPQSQLPSYVDDVVEGYLLSNVFYTDSGHTIVIPAETGKIYIDITTGQNNKEYRYSGSTYIQITNGLIATSDDVAEGATNLYYTTARSALKQDVLTDVNFGSFINGLTGKTTPIDADSVSIVDSADSNKQKKVSLANFKTYLKTYFDTLYSALTDVIFGSFISSLSAKTTPIDADYDVIMDSADSNKAKKVSWANRKATLKTYFDTLYQTILVSGTSIKTYAGVSILGSGDIPVQATITTATSITNATTTTGGYAQHGKNIILDNGANNINYTINSAITASFVKHGSGTITFVQGSGRTLIQVDNNAVLSGVVGSTATISSVGTTDYLRISNA